MTPMADTRKRLPYLEKQCTLCHPPHRARGEERKGIWSTSTTQEAKMDDLVKGRSYFHRFSPHTQNSLKNLCVESCQVFRAAGET